MTGSLLRRCLSAAALALAAFGPLPALAYSDWFVFGDSLSDTGNNAILLGIDADQVITGNSYIPTYPYASGRYSNGEVWTTSFAQALGLQATASLAGGNIYAHGGGRTRVVSPDGAPPLRTQVQSFLSATGGVADPGALYVIAGGGNNARDTLDAIAGGAPIVRTLLGDAWRYAYDVGLMVDQLQAAGAQHIIVWNTPNLSLAPAVQAEGDLAVKLADAVVGRMNGVLAKRLEGEAGVKVLDTYAIFTSVIGDPGAYGLVNASDACGAIAGCDPSSYLFWDGIHPTAAGHRILADAMIAAAVPEPAAAWLLAAGLGVLLIRVRRRTQA